MSEYDKGNQWYAPTAKRSYQRYYFFIAVLPSLGQGSFLGGGEERW